MREFGNVEIPQNAFFEALKMGDKQLMLVIFKDYF